MEEFKKMEDAPYLISNKGYLINTNTGKQSLGSKKQTGYIEVTIQTDAGEEKSISLHRLVASYFVPVREGASEVNHKDGDKTNNSAENLEWVTHNENLKHAYITGLRPDDVSARGVIATNIETGEEMEFPSIYKAARFFGISQGNICMCCKGLRPYANGYYWRYKEEK